MDSGIYAATSALMARSQALDILSNNLANVSTTGYKGESQFYQALNAAAGEPGQGALDSAVNQFGVLAGQMVNLQQGTIQSTGNPLDLAIQGPGLLQAQTRSGIALTRAGSLQVGASGVLETAEGDPVLGDLGKGKTGPIKMPSGKPSIAPDGTISVNGAVVGKLALVELSSAAGVQPLGDAYFTAAPGAAKPATGSTIVAGSLEGSNVNAIQAETDLVSLQRHFDLLERAIKIFNTDFDQPAATQLPSVNA